MSRIHKDAVAITALVASAAFLYSGVLTKLAHDWAADGDYSHGFLIVPIALYLGWERRVRLKGLARRYRPMGLPLLLASLMILVVGTLGAELFLMRVSIIGIVAGIVLFLWGWEHLTVLRFPIAFLLLMIPLPAIVFNRITFPLQLLASRFGETTLSAFGVPVLREGNVMILANTTLEVAEACSGIRSLVSLLTLAIMYGYWTDPRGMARTALVLVTIPIAIFANGIRVAGTGLAASIYGPQAAEGFLHSFSGWVIFATAFAMLVMVRQLLVVLAPQKAGTQMAAAA